MTIHTFLDDDLRDEAAAFVLGALPEDEARRYRLHIRSCTVCGSEVEAIQRITEKLGGLVSEVTPPPALWDRLLDRVRRTPPAPPNAPASAPHAATASGDGTGGQIWKRWSDDSALGQAFAYAMQVDGAFEPTSVPGVRARKLFVDAEAERVTMLVRMDPGTSYPAHRHTGAEDCYVLSGDLDAGERELHGGDYIRAAPGSVHAVQSTRDGCLLFIVSSLHDELLA